MADVNEVQNLEAQKVKAQEDIAFADKVQKLRSNRLFKEIFEDNLFSETVSRLNRVSVSPSASAEIKERAKERMQSIGYIQVMLDEFVIAGQYAEDAIGSIDSSLEEARAED